MPTGSLLELVKAARLREAARYGLVLNESDEDNQILYILHPANQPLEFKFDKVISTEPLFNFPDEVKSSITDWIVGIFNGGVVVVIKVHDWVLERDSEAPEVINTLDAISDRCAQFVLLTNIIFPLPIKRVVKKTLFNELRKLRLERVQKLLQAKQTRRLLKGEARLTKKIAKQEKVIKSINIKLARNTKVIGTLRGIQYTLTGVVLAAGIIDIILISYRTLAGYQRGRLAGALGGFVGGTVDAATIGLAPGLADIAESVVEDAGNILYKEFVSDPVRFLESLKNW